MMTSLIALAAAQAATQPSPVQRPPVYVPRIPSPMPPPPPPPSAPMPAPWPARQIGGSIYAEDYPAAAIRAGEQGATRVRITVGTDGRVTGCMVIGSSGSSLLDSTTCQLVTRRFRYQPALRGDRPVEGVVTRLVVWRLPEGPEINFVQGRFTWIVTVSPAGATECRIEQIGTAFAQFDTGQCSDPKGDRMVAFDEMGAGHPATRITNILSVLPNGEASSLPRLPGTPFAEWVVQVEAAPDGRVTACTPLSQQGTPPAYAYPHYKFGCQSLMNASVFVPTSLEGVRRARIGSALYVEVVARGAR